jgi:hypothetical protein
VINTFAEIANVIFQIIPVLLGILGYATTIRAFIKKKYGEYDLGISDGIIATLFIMALIFYIQSL